MRFNITCPLRHSVHVSVTTWGQVEKAEQMLLFVLYVNQLQPSTFRQKLRQEFSPKVKDWDISIPSWHSPSVKQTLSISEKSNK